MCRCCVKVEVLRRCLYLFLFSCMVLFKRFESSRVGERVFPTIAARGLWVDSVLCDELSCVKNFTTLYKSNCIELLHDLYLTIFG